MTRFCKDCRWFRPSQFDPTCGHPSSLWRPGLDLVTGETRPPVPLPCREVRLWDDLSHPDGCNRQGRHWEPADPPGFV